MKRLLMPAVLLAILLPLGGCRTGQVAPVPKTIRIGFSQYYQYDTFIGELTNHFLTYAQEVEQREGVTITVMRGSADGSQEAQNSQVESFIDAGCDVLCINLVDRTDVSVIIDKAEAAGLPIIFFNRELVEEDLHRNNQLFYVGADALESGRMQGEIVADLCGADMGRVDRNGDGVLQYVMLEGEADHQDAIVRTEHSIAALVELGYRVERLEDEIANWIRSQAESKMRQWLDLHGDAIEVVLANNDDMALGAVDALRRAGVPFGDWPVIVGIDGTSGGLEAVSLGEMAGTVYNDAVGQAKGLLDLSYALAVGGRSPRWRRASTSACPTKRSRRITCCNTSAGNSQLNKEKPSPKSAGFSVGRFKIPSFNFSFWGIKPQFAGGMQARACLRRSRLTTKTQGALQPN